MSVLRSARLRDEAGRFIRYVLVGGAAAVVDVTGLILLEPRLPLAAAAVASFLIAMVFNFALSAAFAFAMPATWARFAAFAVAATAGLAINATITVVLVREAHLAPGLAKLCGIAVAFGFNFALNTLVVFRKRAG